MDDGPECVLPRALCLALRVSRWFGLAPLRLRNRLAAPAPDLSPVVVYSHALLLLSDLNLISLINDINNLRIIFTAKEVATVLIGMIITLVIYTESVVSGTARMKCIVDTLLRVDQVMLGVPERFVSEHGQVKQRILTIFIFLFPTMLILLSAYHNKIDMFSGRFKIYEFVVLVGIRFTDLQFVLVVTSLSLAMRTVTDRTSTVFANINLYSLETTDIEVAEAALRDATRRYCQLRAAARKLCLGFSYHLTMTLAHIVLSISCLVYLIMKTLMVVSHDNWQLMIFTGWLINTTVTLFMINECSNTLYVEKCRLWTVVDAVSSVRGPVRSAARLARRHMALCDIAFKPLRLFTLGRPLTGAVGAIVLSYTLSVFYLGDAMEAYFKKIQGNVTISY